MAENVRIFVHGYYGNTNVGDESILASLLSMIKSEYPNSKICVSSSNREQTLSNHKLVDKTINRRSFRSTDPYIFFKLFSSFDYVKEIRNSDELWIGGGGLIRDSSLYRFSYLMFIAKLFGTKVRFVSPGGAQLSITRRNRFIVKPLFDLADSVIVRDKLTKANLISLGVGNKIHVTADPALALNIEKELCNNLDWLPDKPFAVISVRSPSNRDIDIQSMATFIDLMSESLNFHPVFLPFQSSGKISDIDVSRKVENKMNNCATIVARPVDHKEAYEIIKKSNYLIGMRLHSQILAARIGIPFFGFSYAPKNKAFCEKIGRKAIWCDDFDPHSTAELARSYLLSEKHNITIDELESESVESVQIIKSDSKKDGNRSLYNTFLLLLIIIIVPFIDLINLILNRLTS